MENENLVLKIKNYQEDVTYLTLIIPAYLEESQIIEIGKKAKSIVDDAMGGGCIHEPNVIRFENKYGVYKILNNELTCTQEYIAKRTTFTIPADKVSLKRGEEVK